MAEPPDLRVVDITDRDAADLDECSRDTIALLREFLERAEAGEIKEVVLCAITFDGTAKLRRSRSLDTRSTLGTLAFMQHCVLTEVIAP
jgi:hypothetical protein